MTRISSDFKICATCSHWCGTAIPDSLCATIQYDPSERARCAGGVFNMCTMSGGQCACNGWNQRFRR